MKGLVIWIPPASSPHPLSFFSTHHHCYNSNFPPPQFPVFSTTQNHHKFTPFHSLSSSSSSSSSSVIEEEEQDSSSSSSLPSSLVESVNDNNGDSAPLPFSGCQACGREKVERGCNGEGRIQGGIATIPGFGWWPIKAYRPCPGFVACGGNYRRRGQSMDEVAFGGGKGVTSMDYDDDFDESGTRKKGTDRRRFKR